MDRDLTKEEFARYHDLIYKIAGIHYPSEKLELLSNRIRRRLRATNEASFDSYLRRIAQGSESKERQEFLNSITTNETYFFRCQRHWDHFRAWLEEKKKDPDTRRNGLRLWSAAASNGAEACTMLIVLHQVFGDGFGGVSVDIVGTDLSTAILDEARAARFRPYALAQTPPQVVDKYFTKADKDEYVFDRRLLQHVRFQQHNLMDKLTVPQPFDAVFVRNVMIYFDQESRERVLQHAFDLMRPGGLLIVGESESLLSVKHGFEYVKPSIFVKPIAGAVAKKPTPAR
ncbi:MAG: protein-glutamate O-methyltransferase CheR [Planctomycetes bacterium]|nr:protein-glutamate O-methyltransferase CheR [Planctomycetota bacterium]